MSRWPLAVGVSVGAHVLLGLFGWAALKLHDGRVSPSHPTPPMEVLRIGALLPRPHVGVAGSEPLAPSPETRAPRLRRGPSAPPGEVANSPPTPGPGAPSSSTPGDNGQPRPAAEEPTHEATGLALVDEDPSRGSGAGDGTSGAAQATGGPVAAGG
jgi:hypothetical protein